MPIVKTIKIRYYDCVICQRNFEKGRFKFTYEITDSFFFFYKIVVTLDTVSLLINRWDNRIFDYDFGQRIAI